MREQQAQQLQKEHHGIIIRSAADRLEDKLFAGLELSNSCTRSIPLSKSRFA